MPENTTHHNVPEYSVSDIAFALKQTVEERFSHVRVRGELSGFKQAASGHAYFTLKDDKSALNAICWRGTMGKLPFKPEDGLEVVCTGRMSTYPGRSNYQLVVEYMEPAGVGALMALLEKRKSQLAKEGLFDADCKQPLPFMPQVIGVVTSPTGAVIRDILHRIEERFPVHVLVWPVLVQGEQAAAQIEAAIRGFNTIKSGGKVPRPDVLIVARGGGSIEDLWPFNEENVVRAVAESAIPLISAVGHETDTTLLDYASDKRAPTPTAAAEFAVPVRAELQAAINHTESRLVRVLQRCLDQSREQLQQASRLMPAVLRFSEYLTQRMDTLSNRFEHQGERVLERKAAELAQVSSRLRHPREWLEMATERKTRLVQRLKTACDTRFSDAGRQLASAASGLRILAIEREMAQQSEKMQHYSARLTQSVEKLMEEREKRVSQSFRLLDSYHYKKVLARGFALVWNDKKLVTSKNAAQETSALTLEFADGKLAVLPQSSESGANMQAKKPKKSKVNPNQESLF